jgi:hypothetical protein
MAVGNSKPGEINFMRITLLTLLLLVSVAPQVWGQEFKANPCVAPVTDKSNEPAPFTLHERFLFFEKTTISPFAAAGPITGSALSQWITGNPPEWGQGFPGYGRRLLSGYTRQIIANSIGFGVALAAHEDPRHYPTGERGFWMRSLYAARESFVSHNSSGGLMPAYSRIIGAYGAGFISNAWYPAPYSNVHSALFRGSTALASNIVWQEFREFWPDVHHKLDFRHSGS